MRQNPSDADLETYELNISTFENGQPEELLKLMKNFKRVFDGTGTTTAAEKTNYLRNVLREEALREFYELSNQNTGTNNTHLEFIQEGLLGYFPPINALSKQKPTMRRAMRKPRDLPFKRFAARLTELNNYLPLFPWSSAVNNMPPE